jgi:hypothetical protein
MGEHGWESHRYHFHFMVAGVQHSDVRQAVALWQRVAGRAEIGLYDPTLRGLEYALKSMEDTSDFDFDAQLHKQHLLPECFSKSPQAEPAKLTTTDDLHRHPTIDVTPQQSAGIASDEFMPAERSIVVREDADEGSALPARSRTATQSLKGISRVKTMKELWLAMRRRCRSPKPPNFKSCDNRPIMAWRWMKYHGFELFVRDMGERPSPLHRLHRIDPEVGYGPSNCIWAVPGDR